MPAQHGGLRVLGRVRLSRSSEESTSVERQRDVIAKWSEANGHSLIGWAEDIDVSGSVSPFDTVQLGDWLAHKHPEFDVVAAWKLDRLSRSTVNLNRLIVWCHDHDKTIVSATEGIDISTPIGRLITSVISFLAEGELEAIRERTRGSRAKLRELARWPGGKPPLGYRSVKVNGGGHRLEIDPHGKAIVDRIVREFISGASLSRIAEALTAEAIPTPTQYYRRLSAPEAPAGEWRLTTLRRMLTSPALRGRLHHTVHSPGCTSHGSAWCKHHCSHRAVVRDDDGQPVQFGPPLVDSDQWDRIQQRLAETQGKSFRQTQASPLSGLLTCLACGAAMHFDPVTVRGTTYNYYRCAKGLCTKIRAEELEALAEETFLSELGDTEVREQVWVPGDSHEAELREAVAALDELSQAAGRMTSATARQRLQSQLSALDARIAELESAPIREARWEYRAIGQTYGDAWKAADVAERRAMLKKSGITFAARVVGGRGSKAREFDIRIPSEIRMH